MTMQPLDPKKLMPDELAMFEASIVRSERIPAAWIFRLLLRLQACRDELRTLKEIH